MGYKADEYRTIRKNPVEKLRADSDLDMGIHIGEVIVTPKMKPSDGLFIFKTKDRNDPRGYQMLSSHLQAQHQCKSRTTKRKNIKTQ